MAAKSHLRGHEIEWRNGRWQYSDIGDVANYDRPCARCGKMPTPEGYDACLGFIPGAKYACCGHGINEPFSLPNQGLQSSPEARAD
jgi:hypothetical protein